MKYPNNMSSAMVFGIPIRKIDKDIILYNTIKSLGVSEWDVVASDLIIHFFFWQYWEPPGLPFPLRAAYTLFLLTSYFFCNLDQEVLFNSYSLQSK